jgi:hypothetical protein
VINNLDAIVIAVVGVVGTLAGSIVGQLLTARTRRYELEIQRSQQQEDYARKRRVAELADKRSCYIAMMTSSRRYRVEVMNYLYAVKERTVDATARSDLESARRACLDSLGEVQIVATLEVLATIDPVNSGLSNAYRATKRLEAGEPEPDGSFEEIYQSLTDLWDQWHHMREAMRKDLGVKD